ncbi:MAG TPA: hypothetical protein VJ746_04275 [Nitrospira sp.]|nr:hypothetical protein [Nitrospira sp.]
MCLSIGTLFDGYSLAEDSPGRHSFPLEPNAPPAVGNIAGVKLSIPHHYLLSGVHYQGEEVWKPNRTPPPPRTYDTVIEDFAILLRLSTLTPITTSQDWADYRASAGTAETRPGKRWITVGFLSDMYRSSRGRLEHTVDVYLKDKSGFGPFELQRQEVFGLKHARSPKKTNEKAWYGDTDEIFYDPVGFETFIRCASYLRKVEPFDLMTHCEHLFAVHEIKVVAKGYIQKEDLPRWREIEAAIRKIAHTFVVE